MPSSVTYDGWGEPAWDDGSWGTDLTTVSVDGIAATGGLGSVTVSGIANVPVTNVSGQTHLNTISVIIDMPISVVGIGATTSLGIVRANAWKLIDDGQVPHWGPVDDSQTPSWINIST